MILLFIWLLTIAMVLDCVVLIFLVLIQLPKKDAGAGLAFGGSATDALFGAGSGNVLTKITKYAAGIFFALAVVVALLQSHQRGAAGRQFSSDLSKVGATAPASAPLLPQTAPATTGTSTPTLNLSSVPEATNLPAAVTTNLAPAPVVAPSNAPGAAQPKP